MSAQDEKSNQAFNDGDSNNSCLIIGHSGSRYEHEVQILLQKLQENKSLDDDAKSDLNSLITLLTSLQKKDGQNSFLRPARASPSGMESTSQEKSSSKTESKSALNLADPPVTPSAEVSAPPDSIQLQSPRAQNRRHQDRYTFIFPWKSRSYTHLGRKLFPTSVLNCSV